MSPRIFLAATLSGLTLCLACGSTVHEATGGGGATSVGGSGTSGSGGTAGKGGGSAGVGAGGTGAGGAGVAGASGGKAGNGGAGATGGTSPTGGAAGKGGGAVAGSQCKSSADCAAGQQCNLWDTTLNVTRCSTAAGGKVLGTPCTNAAECMTGMCFDTFTQPWGFSGSKTCSLFCKTDADCGGSAAFVCVDYLYPNDTKPATKRQCMQTCSLDSQCPATGLCVAQDDPTGKRVVTVCNGPAGTGAYGIDATIGGCQTGLATKSLPTKSYCTHTCASATDCTPIGGNATQCLGVKYAGADGTYSNVIKSCD